MHWWISRCIYLKRKNCWNNSELLPFNWSNHSVLMCTRCSKWMIFNVEFFILPIDDVSAQHWTTKFVVKIIADRQIHLSANTAMWDKFQWHKHQNWKFTVLIVIKLKKTVARKKIERTTGNWHINGGFINLLIYVWLWV